MSAPSFSPENKECKPQKDMIKHKAKLKHTVSLTMGTLSEAMNNSIRGDWTRKERKSHGKRR